MTNKAASKVLFMIEKYKLSDQYKQPMNRKNHLLKQCSTTSCFLFLWLAAQIFYFHHKQNVIKFLLLLASEIDSHIIETFFRIQNINKVQSMAFVFSQPRWTSIKQGDTPGPGSHCPDITQNLLNRAQHNGNTSAKPKIHKGKAFTKYREQQAIQKRQLNGQTQNTQTLSEKRRSPLVEKKGYRNQGNKNTIIINTKGLRFNRDKQNMSQLFQIKVQSLQHEVAENCFSLEASNSGSKCENKQKISINDYEKIKYKKSNASIRAVSEEQFYIGSRDELKKKNSKPIKQSTTDKKQQKFRIRCSLNNNQGELEMNFDSSPLIQGCQITGKLHQKNKSISPKHPFHKKTLNEQNYEENSTGIQDDDSEQSEFIFDPVPGPGSYQIGIFSQSTKKCMMFTEKNKGRFSNNQKQNISTSQFIYSFKPLTGQSKSRASQKKVGFGRSVMRNSVNKLSTEQVTKFYQNFGSIQNKCLKQKLKDSSSPGFFASKASRFPQQTPKLSSQTCKLDYEKQDQIKKVKKIFYEQKPTHPFSSGVERKTPQLTQIFDVSYKGQQYKTMDNNLKKLMSQPKYLFESQDQQLAAQQKQIMENELKKAVQQKRIKSDIQIKHQLIDSIYGFRQREKKTIRKREMKGFTFSVKQTDYAQKQNSPEPGQYHRDPEWVKNSFNLRFAQGYPQQKFQKWNSNEQPNLQCKSEAIKIIRL